MVGSPASGKTTFAKEHLIKDDSCIYISKDEIRLSILSEKDAYFSKEKQVFKLFVDKITKNLKNPNIKYIIADATHLTSQSRIKFINALNIPPILKKSLDIIPVVIEANELDIISRNEQRNEKTKLPLSALKTMYKSFVDPKLDPYEYTAIMYVNTSKQLEVVETPKILYTKKDTKIKPMTLKSLLKERKYKYGNMDNF